jgi:hypothetical protein
MNTKEQILGELKKKWSKVRVSPVHNIGLHPAMVQEMVEDISTALDQAVEGENKRWIGKLLLEGGFTIDEIREIINKEEVTDKDRV